MFSFNIQRFNSIKTILFLLLLTNYVGVSHAAELDLSKSNTAKNIAADNQFNQGQSQFLGVDSSTELFASNALNHLQELGKSYLISNNDDRRKQPFDQSYGAGSKPVAGGRPTQFGFSDSLFGACDALDFSLFKSYFSRYGPSGRTIGGEGGYSELGALGIEGSGIHTGSADITLLPSKGGFVVFCPVEGPNESALVTIRHYQGPIRDSDSNPASDALADHTHQPGEGVDWQTNPNGWKHVYNFKDDSNVNIGMGFAFWYTSSEERQIRMQIRGSKDFYWAVFN